MEIRTDLAVEAKQLFCGGRKIKEIANNIEE